MKNTTLKKYTSKDKALRNYIDSEYTELEWENFSDYSKKEIESSIESHINLLNDKGIEATVDNINKSIADTWELVKKLDLIEKAKKSLKNSKENYDYAVLDQDGNILKKATY